MAKKILLIDDYAPLREEVAEYLQFEGYDVVTAQNGAEGVQKAIISKPDMILCDILMPELDGYEVFKTINSIPALSVIPFIFLTAKATPDDYKKGLSLGVDDYLTKPFSADALISSINKRFEKVEKYMSTKKDLIEFLFNNPLMGIVVYSNKKFIYLNDKAKEFVGYNLNDINNIPINKIIINTDFDIEREYVLLSTGAKKEILTSLIIYTQDKKFNNLEMFGKLIIIDNKESLILAFTKKIDPTVSKISQSLEKFQEFFDVYNNKDISDEITKLLRTEIQQQDTKPLKIKLSSREIEVLELICIGRTNKEVAEKLSISSRTAENHRAAILEKTKTRNTAELVAFAIRNKLINVNNII